MENQLDSLEVWNDPVARSAPENMAVDELLLKGVQEHPIIRFYQWAEPSMSFGYFDSYSSAKEKFPDEELTIVRRWTGGGVVDHRQDVTYTMVIPRAHEWAGLRGAESYRIIHKAVEGMLRQMGIQAVLTQSDFETDSVACFEKPVTYDVVDSMGQKLAGAGQRRTKWGLLHQGSIQGVSYDSRWKELLLKELAREYAVVEKFLSIPPEVAELVFKYASAAWLHKR